MYKPPANKLPRSETGPRLLVYTGKDIIRFYYDMTRRPAGLQWQKPLLSSTPRSKFRVSGSPGAKETLRSVWKKKKEQGAPRSAPGGCGRSRGEASVFFSSEKNRRWVAPGCLWTTNASRSGARERGVGHLTVYSLVARSHFLVRKTGVGERRAVCPG